MPVHKLVNWLICHDPAHYDQSNATEKLGLSVENVKLSEQNTVSISTELFCQKIDACFRVFKSNLF